MVWEAVFFLLVLKIPVVYLALVVWWAVRPEPQRGEPARVAVVADTPPGGPGVRGPGRSARRPRSGRPHERRSRSSAARGRREARR